MLYLKNMLKYDIHLWKFKFKCKQKYNFPLQNIVFIGKEKMVLDISSISFLCKSLKSRILFLLYPVLSY